MISMSPSQEALNAATMLLPTASLLHLASATTEKLNQFQWALLLGTAAHMPLSVAYHMGVALGMFRDRLDNRFRRMDQAMQHVLCVLFSWALSKGSVPFTVLNVAINMHFLRQIVCKNDGRRWIPVAMCTFLYTLPIIAWQGDVKNYVIAALSMTMGGLAFVPTINMQVFRGWGHSLFHCALAIYARALHRTLN